MTMIDTHTHLYSRQFEQDQAAMMQRALEAGIERFYLPAIDSGSTERMLQMETDYPGKCFAMMGLHPCSVKENHLEELKLVEAWLEKRKFPAIGEIGLDFYWDKTFTAQQYEAFHLQIALALRYHLPIVIHTRNATRETIEVVAPYIDKGLTGIFHCFGGTIEEAKQITEMGFLLGIGGVVTYKNGGLPEVLKQIPIEHIVLETDAPYLSPVPYRGKRNESAYLKFVAEKLADIYQLGVEEVADKTSANALRLFAY